MSETAVLRKFYFVFIALIVGLAGCHRPQLDRDGCKKGLRPSTIATTALCFTYTHHADRSRTTRVYEILPADGFLLRAEFTQPESDYVVYIGDLEAGQTATITFTNPPKVTKSKVKR